MNTRADIPGPDAPDPSISNGARTRRAPGFREASMHDLFADCCRIGPAPTRSREIFVIATTVALLAIIFVIVGASPIFIATASIIVAVYLIGRWVYGERNRWSIR